MRDTDEFLDDLDTAVSEWVEWDGSVDAGTWTADGSHEPDEIDGNYYGWDSPGGGRFHPSTGLMQVMPSTSDWLEVVPPGTGQWVASFAAWSRAFSVAAAAAADALRMFDRAMNGAPSTAEFYIEWWHDGHDADTFWFDEVAVWQRANPAPVEIEDDWRGSTVQRIPQAGPRPVEDLPYRHYPLHVRTMPAPAPSGPVAHVPGGLAAQHTQYGPQRHPRVARPRAL